MPLLTSLSRWLSHEDCLDPQDATTHASHLLVSLMTMAWLIEARASYTGGHMGRVSRYARLVAEQLGYGEGDATRINLGRCLHDLGKITVPDTILRKTRALTDEEYAIIKTHPDVGFRLLAGHPLAELVKGAVLLHHERPDGRGYPRGLAGDVIPLMARIVGVRDAFDAMTSHRPYRSGKPRDRALSIIAEARDAESDLVTAAVFLVIGTRGILEHAISHSNDEIRLHDCSMCVTLLMIGHERHACDHVYCPNCSGKFEFRDDQALLWAISTSGEAQTADLTPDLDAALIAKTLLDAVAMLQTQELLKACALPGLDKRCVLGSNFGSRRALSSAPPGSLCSVAWYRM